MSDLPSNSRMANRFRGFLPVVIDVETGGFNARTDALLEIAAVLLEILPDGQFRPGATMRYHITPFEGANMEPASLEVNRIDPHHPLRPAIPEKDALQRVFREVRSALKAEGCTRAILVGHNAAFDLGFINAAIERTRIRRNPFHTFSTFDTATMAGIALGQTVLARALDAAHIGWDANEAHSALYDAERTAELFCEIVNRYRPIYEKTRRRR